jgi:hypothetical protein
VTIRELIQAVLTQQVQADSDGRYPSSVDLSKEADSQAAAVADDESQQADQNPSGCAPEQVFGLINHLDLSSVSAVRPDTTPTGQEDDSQCGSKAKVTVSESDDHSSNPQDSSPKVGTSTKGKPIPPQYDVIAAILKQTFQIKDEESELNNYSESIHFQDNNQDYSK